MLNNEWTPAQRLEVLEGVQTSAAIATIGGTLLSAVGGFYAAKSRQAQLNSQASALRHQANMADINARAVESQVQDIIRAGRFEKGKLQLAGRQQRGKIRTSTAARGGRVGQGSSAEVEASQRLIESIEAMTIDSNAERQAGQARMQAVSLRNRADMARVSAGNVSASARSIDTITPAVTTLLGGAGQLAGQWADDLRWS